MLFPGHPCDDADLLIAATAPETCRVLVTGNTTQMINPGSVGQPRDGDPRPAYAMIEDGQVEFRRVAYDIDRTVQHMRDSGIEEVVIAKAEVVLRSGGNPSSTGNAEL